MSGRHVAIAEVFTLSRKVLCVAVLAAIYAAPAWACECSADVSIETAFQEASAVFIGRVVSSKQHRESSDGFRFVTEEAQLLVERAWKGVQVGDRISIYSNIGPGTCGKSLRNDLKSLEVFPASDEVPFSDTWIVFSYGGEPLELNLCSEHSGSTNVFEKEMQFLDALKTVN